MKATKNPDTIKKDIQALLPVLIALCIIPLIVLTKDYQTEFTKFVWFNNTEIDQIDSFEYTKGIFVIIMGAIAALVIIFHEYSQIQKKKRLFENTDIKVCILWAIYLVMVILSSVLSEHPNLAFTGGGYGQWQTMWVLLGYTMLFMYAYTFINSESRGLLTIKFMMITTGILALLGILQTAGHNPLGWDWLQKIITSQSTTEGIDFKEGVSNVILTFNNPNYVGPYVALVLPVTVSFIAIRASEDKIKTIACRIAGVLIAAGLIISLAGASSSAGMISVAAGIVFAGILLLSGLFSREKCGKHTKGIIICVAAVLILAGAGFFLAKSPFMETTINKILQGSEDTRNIASIINKKDELRVTLRNDTKFTLVPKLDAAGNLSFTAYDADKQPVTVQYQADQKCYTLADERFQMITLVSNKFSVENNVYSGFKFNDAPNSISWTFMYVDGPRIH